MTPSHVSESPFSTRPVAARRRALATPAPADPGGATSAREHANILIVDRDSRTRQALGEWFGERRHFVAFAGDHETAAATLRTLRFDLILCDAAASSHAARRWIEQLYLQPPCPVLFLSSHPTLEAAIRIANLPVAGYLMKPIDFALLESAVARCLVRPGPRPGATGR